jgi:uncharacterized membrane protein YwzB
MNLEINIATVIIGSVGLIVNLLIALLAWFALRSVKAIDDKFDSLSKKADNTNAELHRIDRDLLTLKAELPNQYQRREDAIRQETILNAKVDKIYELIERKLK